MIVDSRPGFAAVEGDACAAVVAFNHAPGVGRVYPKVVVVAVWHRHRGEVASAIDGLVGATFHDVYRFGVLGVGDDVAVIPGASSYICVVGDYFPGVATVVGAE